MGLRQFAHRLMACFRFDPREHRFADSTASEGQCGGIFFRRCDDGCDEFRRTRHGTAPGILACFVNPNEAAQWGAFVTERGQSRCIVVIDFGRVRPDILTGRLTKHARGIHICSFLVRSFCLIVFRRCYYETHQTDFIYFFVRQLYECRGSELTSIFRRRARTWPKRV